MNKKGAINLSINMIIVLVIAIIVLGFALSFITGMFRDVETSLQGQFPEPEVTVTSENPIGIGSELLIQEGEIQKKTLKVLNTKDTNINTKKANIEITCLDSATAPEVTASEEKTIESGASKSFKIVLNGKTGMINNKICTFKVDGVTQTFFLNTE